MLQSLSLRNFQAHYKRTIKFASITCVVGRSDVGKTALLRALRWCLFSRPQGTHFISHDKSNCAVRVVVDDNEIIRKRTKSENSYKLNGQSYKAIGTDVPEDIARVANLSEVNVQSQHDAAFWLSLTPGQVSKELNKIVDLGVIDRSLANVSAKLRKSKSTVEVTQERLDEAEQQLTDLAWVEVATEQLERVNSLASQIDEKRETAAQIASLIENAQKYEGAQRNAAQTLSDARIVLEKAEQALELQGRLELLIRLRESIEVSQEAIDETEQELKQVEKRLSDVKECPLCRQLIK